MLAPVLSSQAQARPPKVPATAPLQIPIPDFSVHSLSCGLKVLVLKDGKRPLVSAQLMVPGGHGADPAGKEGLAELMAELMRNGGAGSLSPEAFDAALEDKATSMSVSEDAESFTADFKCLSQDLPEVLGLFADMIRSPRFDAKRLEAEKTAVMDGLKRLSDTPDTLTRVLFYRTLMNGGPFGRWASPKSLSGIGQGDLAAFHKRCFGPRGSVLALAGDLDEDKVLARLEVLFKGWKAQDGTAPPKEASPKGPTIYFYPKDVTQVFLRYGLLGLKRHDPRDVPLQVANYILGGSGFTSRLMQQIRSDRGLAYFVYSYSLPFNARGPYQILGGTRPDSVKEYLTLLFQLTGKFAKEGPTESELLDAKQSIIEEFAYHFESPYDLASYKAVLDFNGYPEDYLGKYRSKVRAVTREDAAKAAKSILDQKEWVLTVCGPASLEKDLSAFGKVVKIGDIFGPLDGKQ